MPVLYDQFGREIKVEKRPEPREVAVTTVRDRWSAYPSQGLTAESLATIFKEADAGNVYRQAELFEEMEEKDTHLFSQLQTRKNAVLGLEREILPASESAEDKKIRDFVADVIDGLEDFDDCLLDALDAIGKGFSMHEIHWGLDSGRHVIAGLNWIHPKKAVFYELTKGLWEKSIEAPRVMTEAEPVNGEEMPPFKLMYHRYKARSGYDTRAGVLRVCAWMYLFKNYAIKDWVAFCEVFGMPLRLGKYDTGASVDDKAALVAAIRSLGSDAAGIISKNTEIEFVEALKGSTKENVYKTLAEFADKQMSKAILGQLASTEGTPGKLGGDDAQDNVRDDLLEADSKALGKTNRFQIFRPLVGYNFGWDKPVPTLRFQYEPPEDLSNLSTMYMNLRKIGQPISAEHVSARFKVPMPQKGETLLETPAAGLMAMKRYALKDDKGSPPGTRRYVLKDDAPEVVEAELLVEQQRQRFVGRYLAAVAPLEQDARAQALSEVVSLMESGGVLTEEQFTASVYGILEEAYGALDQAVLRAPLRDVYSFYRLKDISLWAGEKPGLAFTWNTIDDRTLDFLEGVDRFYLGKYISNTDMQGPVMEFLQEQYLEKGAGLFGRVNADTIKGFRDLFDDRLAQLSDLQVQRICDTSVERMRSYGNISQLHEAGVEYAIVVAVLDSRTSEICQAMNGQRIPVAGMYDTLENEISMAPDEFAAYLKVKPVTIEGALEGDAFPPYHVKCRTRVIMELGEAA